MGLFSSKTVITVSSVAVNLVGNPPDTNKAAVIQAILHGTAVPDEVLDSAMSGISSKAAKMHKYALEEYPLGLPNGSIVGLEQTQASTIKAIIDQEIGKQVVIIYAFNDLLTPTMAAVDYLRSVRGLKFNTNEVTIHSFAGVSHSKPLLLNRGEYIAATNKIRLFYRQYTVTNLGRPTYKEVSEEIPMPSGMFLGDFYCMAAYSILDQNGKVLPGEYFWYTRLRDKLYAELVYNPVLFSDQAFMPIIPIRRDNSDLTSESYKDTELYKASKKMLGIVNLDIDALAATLNSNPDIASIDHAYVMFGVNIHTKEQASLRYLCDFFDYMADQSVYKKQHYVDPNPRLEQWKRNSMFTRLYQGNGTPIDVALNEYGFDISLDYLYVESTLVTGSIGPVGFAASTRKGDDMIFRLQIAALTYKEIYVCEMVHKNTIYQGHAVTTTVSSSTENDNFIIPIHFGIASDMPLMKRNALYYDSFRMVINSYDVQKVKWYQSGIFKVVFFVVALVISIYTGGAGAWLAGLAAAADIGVIAVISYVLPAILIGVAVNYGMKFVAKTVGAEFAMILGAVIAIAAISGVAGNTFNLFGESLPTAQSLLQCSSALIDAGNEIVYDEIMGVMEEIEQFSANAEKKMEVLDAVYASLHTNEDLNPLQMIVFTPPYLAVPSETPEAFYNRTIHNTNIGVLSLDVIENYADIMLKLPEAKYN